MEKTMNWDALVEQCLKKEKELRPELLWLQKMYERFCEREGAVKKGEADRILYQRMYGKNPEKSSDLLKIRYWRTGRHLPANLEQCRRFGEALGLEKEEMSYLFQGYWDRCDRVFWPEESEEEMYVRRIAFMEELIQEYLCKIPPSRMMDLNLNPREIRTHLRHLYFTDAVRCVEVWKKFEMKMIRRHISSVNYAAELERSLKLLGEIPRKTVIRHLILLGNPFVNQRVLNEGLTCLGYLPLTEGHTMTDGARLDDLVLGFLKQYERSCRGTDPQECAAWLRANLRELDGCLLRHGAKNLRFMYFKALKDFCP